MTDEIVGYFCWLRTARGGVTPEKYDKAIDRPLVPNPAREARVISKHPLGEADWMLSLDELAAKYPAP